MQQRHKDMGYKCSDRVGQSPDRLWPVGKSWGAMLPAEQSWGIHAASSSPLLQIVQQSRMFQSRMAGKTLCYSNSNREIVV